MSDKLGDYMKELELVEGSRKAELGKPVIARLDGRAFHTFTKGLTRPFDENLTKLMQATTKYLVEQTGAIVGYTQSDEITLIWYLPENALQQYIFGGRYQKMCSTLSAIATAFFNANLEKYLPSKVGSLPSFDARVWQVPTLHDAYLSLLWRERDAIKNSITMVALSKFPHNTLQNVNGSVKKAMLREIGDPWENYDSCYRKGSYFKRVHEMRALTDEEKSRIPEKFRNDELVERHPVKQVEFPEMNKTDEFLVFA